MSASLCASPVASSPAQAGPRRGSENGLEVAVVPVSVRGRIPASGRARLEADFAAAFERAGISLRPAKGSRECSAPACFGALARELSVTRLVALEVAIESRDYHVSATLRDEQGDAIFEARETCEICGLDEVSGVVESVAARIAGALRGPSVDEAPRIRVVSSPAGAQVRVDGVAVGSTPYEGEVDTGAHVVGVFLAGHVAVEREMSMTPGVMSTAEFELDPMVAREIDSRQRPWGAVSLGFGIAAVGGGIGLLVLPPREYQRRCSGDDVDADGDCRYEFSTRWAGAAVLAAGAVLVTIGTMLLVRHRRSKKAQARLEPTASGLRAVF